MKANKIRPAAIEEQMSKIRLEAHENVLARGLVQYRLDKNSMQRLLEIADAKGLGYGVLARMWLCERLEEEQASTSALKPSMPMKDIRRIVRQEIKEALNLPARKRISTA